MKNIINIVIPKNIKKRLLILMHRRNLKKAYAFDMKRTIKSIPAFNNNFTKNNLRGKITFHYHSIEKGLSNRNLRLGFGQKAFDGLFFAMDQYIELGYPTTDERFQQALSVIKTYIDIHRSKSYEVEMVENKYNIYQAYASESDNDIDACGGVDEISISDLPVYETLNFKELAENRHSIRDFGTKKIEDTKIIEAITIATKTPSVCNRQAYRVYQIKNQNKMEQVFRLQGGLVTQGNNLQQILLVTANKEFMKGYSERNQTYVDGGMFLMSLIYGLTYEQIATCTLNANFNLEREQKMRKLLNLSDSEDLIAFLALGSFDENNKYASSPRDNYRKILKVID